MRTIRTLFAFVLTLSIASGAWAVDEGMTKPRLNTNTVLLTSTPVDIIALTNGAGNIKGYQCMRTASSTAITRLNFYVDGGAAQVVDPGVSFWVADANGDIYSPVIPTNVRFDTSIRVSLQRVGGSGAADCWVSWGLD